MKLDLDALKKLAESLNEKDTETPAKEAPAKETEAEGEDDSEDPVKRAVQTLIEAEKVKDDVKLMALVQKELRKQRKAISSIEDIKDRYVEVTIKAPEDEILSDEGDVTAVKRVKDDGEAVDE